MAAARFGRVRFTWIKPPSIMAAEVRRRADAMEPVLTARMAGLSDDVISYMRSNAPWTDRTTAARNGLDSNARVTGAGRVTLSAFHTVPYGGFLETGTSKMNAYPILRPALEAHYPEVRKIMDDIAGSG
jgi:HK97 gp10 family phage protein